VAPPLGRAALGGAADAGGHRRGAVQQPRALHLQPLPARRLPRPLAARPGAGGACLAPALLFAAYGWIGGYTYAPRYLTDILPVLALLLGRPAERLLAKRWGTAPFAAAVAFGVALQAIGAFCYPAGDSGNEAHGLWTIERSSPVLALRSGPATPHFLRVAAPGLGMREFLSPETARSRMAWREAPPRSSPAAESVALSFCLRNESDREWSSFGGLWGIYAVRLVARWDAVEPGGPPPVQTDLWLARRLSPGAERCYEIQPLTPRVPGSYRLTIEPGQYNGGRFIAFAEWGAQPLQAEIAVTPPAAG
jgi:hypothetical protein